MNKRMAGFDTTTIQLIQIRRMERIYDALAIYPRGDAAIKRLNARYDETVTILLERLGSNVLCHCVDQDKAGFFSDMFKAELGFRPRHYTYQEMLNWLDQSTEPRFPQAKTINH